jgi:hypothetical protein
LRPSGQCSIFVLMNGELSLLSEDAPKPARRAGYGYRFRYWRGASGRRYLFSVVPVEALADFRAVVVMFAEPAANGRMRGRALFTIGPEGTHTLPRKPDDKVLVHFLASTETERQRVVDDLAAVSIRLAA